MPPIFTSNFMKGFRAVNLPSGFPEPLTIPRYSIGMHCRWIPSPQTDWGTVIGQVYAPDSATEPGNSQWSWLYLLLLDPDSPSCGWVDVDWVSEEDLELLPPEPNQ